ncbi:MAG: exosortase/archaeosortase family protein [Deltaproteobacteria bacterium]|nr:exosortase/archaeosortase family protein [Deltaproteobacteria bacterium]
MKATTRLFILLALLAAAVFVLYGEPLAGLVSATLHREGSSHGIFVPFLSGYFVWLKRDRLKKAQLRCSFLPGGVLAAAAFILLYSAHGSKEIMLPILSFLLLTAGLTLTLFGWQLCKEVIFPIFFLVTMVPLPATVYSRLAEWMRSLTTAGCVGFTQLLHLPIYRDGFTLYLPNVSLLVAPSCSGIRYLLSFFVFSLAYAFVLKKSAIARILVVLASVPIAIIAGVLRLSSIALAAYYIGPFMAGHKPHIIVSWLVFGVVLFSAITVDQLASRIGRQSTV